MIKMPLLIKPVIYKILFTSCFFCSFRFTNKAINIHVVCFFFYSYKFCCILVTLIPAIFFVWHCRFKMKTSCRYLLAKKYFWKCQCNTQKFIYDMTHFCGITFQKFLRAGTLKNKFSCKYLFLLHMRKALALIHYCFQFQVSAQFIFCLTCFHLYFATAGNRCKCFTSKTIVRTKKIFNILILLVACRSKLIRASVSLIPFPLSITCTRLFLHQL